MGLTKREAEEIWREFRRTGVKDSRLKAAQELFKGVDKGELRKSDVEKRFRVAARKPYTSGFEPKHVKFLEKVAKQKLD